jgi:hypothetical protein
VKKSRDAGDGKSPEFKRFETAVKKILSVSKTELDTRLAQYKAHKPHEPGPKSRPVK